MTARTLSLASAMLLVAGAIFYDTAALDIEFLQKYPPDFGKTGLARSAALLLAAGFLTYALRHDRDTRRADLDARAAPFRAGMFASYALLLLTVALIAAEQGQLGHLIRETSPVEIGSAVLLCVSCVSLLVTTADKHSGTDVRDRVSRRAIPAVLAAIVLIILGEEVSWGQHYLGFATPELFESNSQKEANLHNFNTWTYENLYYSGATLIFIVLPFFWRDGWLRGAVDAYIPPPSFALLALPVAGMAHETWNIPTIQLGFFVSVAVAVLAIRSPPAPVAQKRGWASLALISIILSAAYFLWQRHELVPPHALTEFKELHIAFLLLAYAAWLQNRTRRSRLGQPQPFSRGREPRREENPTDAGPPARAIR